MPYAIQGEDAWIASQFPRDFTGYAIEVGAYDGQEGSTTLSLEHAGWTTLAIEPNRHLEESIKQWRKNYRLCAAGSQDLEAADFHIHRPGPGGYSSLAPTKDHPVWHPAADAEWETIQVSVRRLDTLIREFGWNHVDALSIDTEGTEMDVLHGFTFSEWKPKAVIIECWDDFGPHIPHMVDRGYKRVDRRLVNDLFLRK